MVYEVGARYIFNAPTIWAYDTAMMLGGVIAVMGWSYTHLYHGHVRVDVIYTHLPTRGKAIIDVVCFIVLFLPLLIVLIYASGDKALSAWETGERLTEGYWYPPAGPIRTVMVVGLFLFALQGVAQFIRDIYLLVRNKVYD
jgi:TRAP-type mannitol/chloroaromatic compound transport system permease small subunit